ncbi:MAG: DUF1570 domain-containing protein [Planctomycetaceae bacterium]
MKRRLAALAILLVASVVGCRTTGGPSNRIVARPTKYAISDERFTVLTDFKLAKDDPVISELKQVRRQVGATLGLPPDGNEVMVYIFGSELEYRQYLEAAYPGLPLRRAYFMGHPRELAVYTYWGDRIREDLRHEFTHGLLHAALEHVPMWLDEGLAEYFEVPGDTAGGLNGDYAQRLTEVLQNGWRPDMRRLERMEEVHHMQSIDYQESWAWVHFLLHSTPENRELLLAHLRELRRTPTAEPLSARLARALPDARDELLAHIATLDAGHRLTSAE